MVCGYEAGHPQTHPHTKTDLTCPAFPRILAERHDQDGDDGDPD